MTTTEKLEALKLKGEGLGYKAIATRLNISPNTIKSYLKLNDRALCLNCKKPLVFTPHKKQKKFCSDACRYAWWNKYRKEVK